MTAVRTFLFLLLVVLPQIAVAQNHTSTSNSASAQNLPNDADAEAMMDAAEDAGPNEQCTDEVTGQFWYKACIPVQTMKPCKKDKWVPCWVYDPVKCCNVLKRKKIQVDAMCPHTDYVERLFCAKISIPRAALKSAPKCDCPDVPTTPDFPVASSQVTNEALTAATDITRQITLNKPRVKAVAGATSPIPSVPISQPQKVRHVETGDVARRQASPSQRHTALHSPAATDPATRAGGNAGHPLYYTTADGSMYQSGTTVIYQGFVQPPQQAVYATYPTVVASPVYYYYGY